MNLTAEEMLQLRCFSDIDRHVASYLQGKGSNDSPIFAAAVMLLSSRLFKGDICLNLNNIAGSSLSDFFFEDDPDYDKCLEVKFPDADMLKETFKSHPAAGDYSAGLPLVIDESGLLYFNKYAGFEQGLARDILSRTAGWAGQDELAGIKDIFFTYFEHTPRETDMQGVAAYLALRNRFLVVSGGPGTGKTSVVIKIISILIGASLKKGEAVSIALTAPTGKAAARLMESVDSAISQNPPHESIRGFIPESAGTIHRLLGYVSGSPSFRHNEENPLPYDVVVVDESSMVDLPLMYRLMKALKPGCRLILLGDRDQLASVEGGAVFGDICDRGVEHGYSPELALEINNYFNLSGSVSVEKNGGSMRDSLVVLDKSYRFGSGSGIGLLADMIKRGDSSALLSVRRENPFKDIIFCEPGKDNYIEKIIYDEWNSYLSRCGNAVDLSETIRGFISSFSILTALRRGEQGMEKMNTLVEGVLNRLGIIKKTGDYYAGRPLMITRNSYGAGLFNGDIGIVAEDGRSVSFSSEGNKFRQVPIMRIPEHETAFSMTIHKSQGSEFDTVFVLLPLKWNRVMTRELLYTAVTRARGKVIISASEDIIKRITESPINRSTGLRDRLWR